MEAKQYDYIFFGAGCASLSIIMRMIKCEKFNAKKILLVEKDRKEKNDRTWCYWETGKGFFEEIVYREWNHLFVNTGDSPIPLQMGDYQYKMIKGIDFYNYCFSFIKLHKNIDIVYGEILFNEDEKKSQVKINGEKFIFNKSAIIFNSLYQLPKKQKNKFYLLQHFKGWVVETPTRHFNPEEATLMDFKVSQTNGTTFVYVLPLSPTQSLVEYTLFSENLLPNIEYDNALTSYLSQNMELKDYKIISEEHGVIPMTNEIFPSYKNGMYYIGTAGGQTKASTGYTFQFIQKQSDKIIKELTAAAGIPSKKANQKKRFYFYDSTLLHILSKKLLAGKTIFSILFKKNSAEIVFKFLENETSISEEIKLLNTLPKKVFIKAGISEFIKIFFQKGKAKNF